MIFLTNQIEKENKQTDQWPQQAKDGLDSSQEKIEMALTYAKWCPTLFIMKEMQFQIITKYGISHFRFAKIKSFIAWWIWQTLEGNGHTHVLLIADRSVNWYKLWREVWQCKKKFAHNSWPCSFSEKNFDLLIFIYICKVIYIQEYYRNV